MTVRVLFFSVLQDLTGLAEAVETLADGRDWTVGDLLGLIEERTPALRDWEGRRLLAVNQIWADRDRLLRDGDEVAIMPPVQGG